MNQAELWSAAGTVAGAIAAVVALMVAYFAYRATRNAADSASTLTKIEGRRLWADLIPQFRVSLQPQTDTYALLEVELVGPPMLDHLDDIRLSIRDDYHARGASQIAGGPSAEEVANHVWGPYRFKRDSDGASENGRTVAPFSLPLGEGTKFALDRQIPPLWNTSGTEASWRREYERKPVRLMLKCKREGFEPWSVPIEVVVAPVSPGETGRKQR